MNIALLTFEHPDTGPSGGIGTYVRTMSRLLRSAGHMVITFTATAGETDFWLNEHTYCIPANDWLDFDDKLPRFFIPVHSELRFDIVEGTDFNACGIAIKKELPKLPLLVKLHTPLFIVDEFLYTPLSFRAKIRFIAGGLRRLRFSLPSTGPDRRNYQREFDIVELAERICSPSHSIKTLMERYGFQIDNARTDIVPLPTASPLNEASKTAIPRRMIVHDARVLFVGRMESRKGIIELTEAIPLILKKHPGTRFIFAGRSSQSPRNNTDMISYLKKKTMPFAYAIEFTGELSRMQLNEQFERADICIFPSYYESFGLACREAMAAGKATIASNAGGMSEIIEHERTGLLIPPYSVSDIAMAIGRLINEDDLRCRIAKQAQERIRNDFPADLIVKMQLNSYISAIKAARCQ